MISSGRRHRDKSIPAKAGTQGHEAAAVALDPRFREGDEGQEPQSAEGGQAYAQAHWTVVIIGFFGFIASANAQTPSSPTATTQFDGTYAFISASKVNETRTSTRTNHIFQCPDYKGGPIIIVDRQARYGNYYRGTVGAQGQLAMRRDPIPVKSGITPGIERMITGRIDDNRTIRARQIGYGCSYDLVWQKQSQ